jgi:hypothetical protein
VRNALASGDKKALRSTAKGYKLHRLSTQVYDTMTTFLDIEIPVLSGRNYRVRTYSKQELYRRYESWCTDQGHAPVSQATFWRRCKKEKIHSSLSGVPCPHCADLRELEAAESLTPAERSKLEKKRRHEAAAIAQRRAYRAARASLTAEDVMIVQDYTYHDYVQLGYQDLVVVFIWKDESGDECTRTRHYVGNEGDKNDVLYSIHAWEKLAQEPILQGKSVKVWSDNGPKHFKCTAYVTYMMCWSWRHSQRHGKAVSLSFFAPYHGASVADRGAAVVKRRVSDRIASESLRMKTNKSLIELANTVLGQEARPIDLPSGVPKPDVKTMAGITKFYEWAPSRTHCAEAWHTCDDRQKGVAPVKFGWPDMKKFPLRWNSDMTDLVYEGAQGQDS